MPSIPLALPLTQNYKNQVTTGSRGGMAPGTDRIDLSGPTAVLVVVDLVLVLLFVVLGEIQHGFTPLEQPLRVLGTYAPFLVGWISVSVLSGVYAKEVRFVVRTALVRTGATWVLAALVGQALRSTALFHGNADPAFVIVSVLVGLVLLVPWRVAVAAFQLLD